VFGPLIAHVAFWTMLALGVLFGELRWRSAAVFVALWLCGALGLERLTPAGGPWVTPYIAVLDIVLALIVFKGDVRLS
jgi:hypothetical protein